MSEGQASTLLIGIHPIESALARAAGQIESISMADGARNPRVLALAERARAAGVPVLTESRAVLDRKSDGQRHQDVVAVFRPGNIWQEKDLAALLEGIDGAPLVLVLDGVQDPHNLGACLRTADAAGVDFVVLPRDRCAGLTPVARRSASGAAEVLNLVFVSNLARALRALKEQGIWLAGTTDQAERSLFDTDLTGPLALVMGGEGKGMRRLTSESCDHLVRIPMKGTVDSLNVSVAAAVCLYEIVRQRGAQ